MVVRLWLNVITFMVGITFMGDTDIILQSEFL